MTVSLNDEVRARLDAHLDAVEGALKAGGSSRERRRGVVDDLEAQILEMLGGKTEAPSVGDLEEVLAKLDPPGAYGQAGGAGVSAGGFTQGPVQVGGSMKPRYSRAAIAGFACILASFFPVLLILLAGLFWSHTTVSSPAPARGAVVPTNIYERDPATGDLQQKVIRMAPEAGSTVSAPAPVASGANWRELVCGLVLIGPLGLAGTVLGWIAFFQIRSSNGALRGRGLALFDGLVYPILAVLGLVVMA